MKQKTPPRYHPWGDTTIYPRSGPANIVGLSYAGKYFLRHLCLNWIMAHAIKKSLIEMCLSQIETAKEALHIKRERGHAVFLRSFQVGWRGGRGSETFYRRYFNCSIFNFLTTLYSPAAVLRLSKDTKMFYQSNTMSLLRCRHRHRAFAQWSVE